MEERRVRRKDLVINFPVRFSYSELRTHFTSEYERVVGRNRVIETLTKQFLVLWKKMKKKENFLNKPQSRSWLETPLPISDENVVEQPGPHLLSSASQNPPTPSVYKPRKPRKKNLTCQLVL